MCTYSHPRLLHLLFLILSRYTSVLTLILKPRQDVAMMKPYSVGSGGEEAGSKKKKKGENGRKGENRDRKTRKER